MHHSSFYGLVLKVLKTCEYNIKKFSDTVKFNYYKLVGVIFGCMYIWAGFNKIMAYCSLRNEMGRNEMERNEMGRNEMEICSLRNGNL